MHRYDLPDVDDKAGSGISDPFLRASILGAPYAGTKRLEDFPDADLLGLDEASRLVNEMRGAVQDAAAAPDFWQPHPEAGDGFWEDTATIPFGEDMIRRMQEIGPDNVVQALFGGKGKGKG